MELWTMALLALVQGLTEFLPISSSAHLILAPRIFQFADQGLAFDVGPSLKRLFGRRQASIERGLGGVMRAAVVELPLFNGNDVEDGEADRSLALAVWFLLGDLELSFTRLRRSHARVNRGKVAWRLPASKKGPAGRGAVRSRR